MIVGVDPGLHATGYGVIRVDADRLVLLDDGVARPVPRAPLGQRVLHLFDELTRVVRSAHPEAMVLESLYIHYEHITTAAMMAHARSVACLVSAQHGVPLIEFLPTRVKKAVTGYGYASKEQVARAVSRWLDIDVDGWPADQTDALALAIAYAHAGDVPSSLRGRTARRGRPALPASLQAAVDAQESRA